MNRFQTGLTGQSPSLGCDQQAEKPAPDWAKHVAGEAAARQAGIQQAWPMPPGQNGASISAAGPSDEILLGAIEGLAEKFAHDTNERSILGSAHRRIRALVEQAHRRSHEIDKAMNSEREARDRLRLARLALGRD